MPGERLQKILAAAGVASRRGGDALIAAGRVTVDGRVAEPGERVDPAAHEIRVDGRAIGAPPAGHAYLALHKPAGVTSTARDRHATRTVLDLVPADLRATGRRVFPVGRLDQDSEGLILLTDDGAWADLLLHPRYGVEREYAVGLDSGLDRTQASSLLDGIALEEGLARLAALRPATATETARLVRLLPPGAVALTWYRATIGQGWKRQLRRMFGAVGAPVRRLVRVRIGTLRLDDLPSGACRALDPREARRLAGTARRPATARPGTDDPVA